MGWIDGNWVDMGSLLIALLYATFKAFRKRTKKVSRQTAMDVANGTSIFPLMLLGASGFSSKVLSELLTSNKLILSVAGVCALLALLEDDF